MEIAESIESLNRQLIDLYGIDSDSGQAIFRIVWSEEQFEKRMMDTTDEGLQLLKPQVRTVPKYRQWIKEKYILERLVIVPEINRDELLFKKSYEPIWTFETQNHEYLPPRLDASKLVIDTLYASLGKKSLRKYIDEEAEHPQEVKELRIKKLQEELFGNETSTGDALAHGFGVGYGPKVN